MNLAPPIPRLERAAPGASAGARRRPRRPPTGRRSRAAPARVRRERHQADYVILVVVVALTAIGILMVYSSSALKGYLSQDADTFATVGPQIQWAILGLVAMAVMMRVDYRYLRLASVPFYIVAVVLLVLVFVPQLNIVDRRVGALAQARAAAGDPPGRVRQARRWSSISPTGSPSAASGSTASGRGTVPFLIIVAPIIALVFKEPDLGTTWSSR